MSESKPARNVAYEQTKVMLDFMAQHVDFATGSLRSLEGRHTSKKLWRELALILNNCRAGTRKTMDGWSRYWSDFKNKLKNKVRILKKRTRLGSTERSIQPLTKLEKRALVILGPHFEKKCHASVDSQLLESDGTKESQDIQLVKLESEMESVPRKQRERDKSPECRTEDEATSDFENDSDDNSNETSMNALYPKWLIEVERKRADAELARARAEEARTQVAARSARAAVTQAAALRSLARAAAAQAEAVARIADILERTPHSLINL